MLKMKGKGIVNSYSSKTQHPGLEGPIKASTLQFVAMHKIEGKNWVYRHPIQEKKRPINSVPHETKSLISSPKKLQTPKNNLLITFNENDKLEKKCKTIQLQSDFGGLTASYTIDCSESNQKKIPIQPEIFRLFDEGIEKDKQNGKFNKGEKYHRKTKSSQKRYNSDLAEVLTDTHFFPQHKKHAIRNKTSENTKSRNAERTCIEKCVKHLSFDRKPMLLKKEKEKEQEKEKEKRSKVEEPKREILKMNEHVLGKSQYESSPVEMIKSFDHGKAAPFRILIKAFVERKPESEYRKEREIVSVIKHLEKMEGKRAKHYHEIKHKLQQNAIHSINQNTYQLNKVQNTYIPSKPSSPISSPHRTHMGIQQFKQSHKAKEQIPHHCFVNYNELDLIPHYVTKFKSFSHLFSRPTSVNLSPVGTILRTDLNIKPKPELPKPPPLEKPKTRNLSDHLRSRTEHSSPHFRGKYSDTNKFLNIKKMIHNTLNIHIMHNTFSSSSSSAASRRNLRQHLKAQSNDWVHINCNYENNTNTHEDPYKNTEIEGFVHVNKNDEVDLFLCQNKISIKMLIGGNNQEQNAGVREKNENCDNAENEILQDERYFICRFVYFMEKQKLQSALYTLREGLKSYSHSFFFKFNYAFLLFLQTKYTKSLEILYELKETHHYNPYIIHNILLNLLKLRRFSEILPYTSIYDLISYSHDNVNTNIQTILNFVNNKLRIEKSETNLSSNSFHNLESAKLELKNGNCESPKEKVENVKKIYSTGEIGKYLKIKKERSWLWRRLGNHRPPQYSSKEKAEVEGKGGDNNDKGEKNAHNRRKVRSGCKSKPPLIPLNATQHDNHPRIHNLNHENNHNYKLGFTKFHRNHYQLINSTHKTFH